MTTRIREGFKGQRAMVLPRAIVHKALATDGPAADLLPTDVGYYPAAAFHYVERSGGSGELILIWCIRGKGWMELAGRRHAINAGEAAVIPPGIAHVYGAAETEPWTIYWMHVAGRRVGWIQKLLGTSTDDPVVSIGEDPAVAGLIEEVMDALAGGYAPADLDLAALAATQRRRGPRSLSVEQRIDQVLRFMREHTGAHVTLEELAAQANLSPSHFSAVFRRRVGRSPLDYFIHQRIGRACAMLDQTDLPIKSIAAELGYDDPLYFSRQFRKIQGISPTQYRKRGPG